MRSPIRAHELSNGAQRILVSVTDVISDLVDMETYWIPSKCNTYLSNNLHDFGKETKIKEWLSSQDRCMDLGKHLNVIPSKQEAVVSSSFL